MTKIITKERLKVLRVKADLTQAELAEKSGITSRSVSLYETDAKNLQKANYSTLQKLAFALGVNVEEIDLGETKEEN